ncbi:MAG: hypothetical protein ACM32E_25285 [Gemmatimonadota bacterium]
MTYQGPPSPKSGKTSAPSRPRQWSDDDTDSDLPPWAGPGVKPRMADSGQSRRSRHAAQPAPEDGDGPVPGVRRRLAQARAKRARRTRYLLAAAALVIVAAGVYEVPKLLAHPAPDNSMGNLVTTFQPGETRTVPDACKAVSAATLSQYLPGTRHTVVPHSLDGRAQSMCDWTVDAPPRYRLLDVTVQAYSPSGLASGNGSATRAAVDAYQQAMQQKANPAKASHQPKAAISALPGLGSAAFSALQVPRAGGDTTDLVTVVARERNVLVTVVFDGLAHSPGGKYGPVSVPQLQAGAVAAARDVLASVH